MEAHRIIAAGAVLAAFAFGNPAALAGERSGAPDTRQVIVQYRVSDLNRAEGGAELLRRLRKAARKACSGSSYRHEWAEIRTCRKQALADAVSRVDRPMLTAALAGKAPLTLARK